jgi:RND family efflux transporter MFP subunit
MKRPGRESLEMKTKLLVAIAISILGLNAVASSDPTVVVRSVTEVHQSAPVIVNGVFRSRRDMLLPATVEGELLWVLEEGTRVSDGMTVAKIDDRQLNLRLEEQELLAKRAAVNEAYLQGEVERLQKLEKANLAARTQLAEMASRRDLARNDVSVAGSRIAQLQETITRTSIKSPVAGIVVERLRQGSEYARRGDGVLRVVNPSALEVKASIPIAYLRRVDDSEVVKVNVGNWSFEAGLRSIIQAGNQNSQTFDVIVDVPEQISNSFVSGQFVEVAIPLTADGSSLYVPRDAVVLRSEGSYVFRIGEDNVAERILVTLGEGQGELVSVLGELSVGDRVAIRGVERLEDGQAVSPVT